MLCNQFALNFSNYSILKEFFFLDKLIYLLIPHIFMNQVHFIIISLLIKTLKFHNLRHISNIDKFSVNCKRLCFLQLQSLYFFCFLIHHKIKFINLCADVLNLQFFGNLIIVSKKSD